MDSFIGQIILCAFGYAPMNFLPCDGSTLEITQYEPLYALLGIQFGGNGSTTFNLPNLVGPTPSNSNGTPLQYCICIEEGLFPVRS